METITGLIGFKKDGQEYTVISKDEKDFEKIKNFYRNNTLENITEIFNSIMWITEDELKNIKNKKYVKNLNNRAHLMALLDEGKIEKVKEKLQLQYKQYKESFCNKMCEFKDNIKFNDYEMATQINCAFVQIGNKLYLRLLKTDALFYYFKILIDLDNDTIVIKRREYFD